MRPRYPEFFKAVCHRSRRWLFQTRPNSNSNKGSWCLNIFKRTSNTYFSAYDGVVIVVALVRLATSALGCKHSGLHDIFQICVQTPEVNPPVVGNKSRGVPASFSSLRRVSRHRSFFGLISRIAIHLGPLWFRWVCSNRSFFGLISCSAIHLGLLNSLFSLVDFYIL